MRLPFPVWLPLPSAAALAASILLGEYARLELGPGSAAATGANVVGLLLVIAAIGWTRRRLAPALAERPYGVVALAGMLSGVAMACLLLVARSLLLGRRPAAVGPVLQYVASSGLLVAGLALLGLFLYHRWAAFMRPVTEAEARQDTGAV